MFDIFIFFREDICNVDSAFNVRDSDDFILDAFTDSIFFDLEMSKTFGCRI